MENTLNLPASSLAEVSKIISGYSHAGDNASLSDIAKLTGIGTTRISGNNKFLNDIGLITGGLKKSSTDLGLKLGRALEHNQEVDIQRCWREVVQSHEAISGIITAVRIKEGMKEADLAAHVLYVSGQKNTSQNRTGSRTVVEILRAACLISENNGLLTVVSPSRGNSAPELEKPLGPSPQAGASQNHNVKPIGVNVEAPGIVAGLSPTQTSPTIAINIELHLPATADDEVYKKLFRALREELIEPKTD